MCACCKQMLVSFVSLVAAECRACIRLFYGIDPRIDLSSCISANHVFEHKLAARMSLCPAIVESQYIVPEDDDSLASSDEVFDLAPCVYAGVSHGGDRRRCLYNKTRRSKEDEIQAGRQRARPSGARPAIVPPREATYSPTLLLHILQAAQHSP